MYHLARLSVDSILGREFRNGFFRFFNFFRYKKDANSRNAEVKTRAENTVKEALNSFQKEYEKTKDAYNQLQSSYEQLKVARAV